MSDMVERDTFGLTEEEMSNMDGNTFEHHRKDVTIRRYLDQLRELGAQKSAFAKTSKYRRDRLLEEVEALETKLHILEESLRHIRGWREIDRVTLRERLTAIEEICDQALTSKGD